MTSFIYQDQELLNKLFLIAQQVEQPNRKAIILKQLENLKQSNQSVNLGNIRQGDRLENHLGSLKDLSAWLQSTGATFNGQLIVEDGKADAEQLSGFLSDLQQKVHQSKNPRLMEQVGAIIYQANKLGMTNLDPDKPATKLAPAETAKKPEHSVVQLNSKVPAEDKETTTEPAPDKPASGHGIGITTPFNNTALDLDWIHKFKAGVASYTENDKRLGRRIFMLLDTLDDDFAKYHQASENTGIEDLTITPQDAPTDAARKIKQDFRSFVGLPGKTHGNLDLIKIVNAILDIISTTTRVLNVFNTAPPPQPLDHDILTNQMQLANSYQDVLQGAARELQAEYESKARVRG
jgi:hypothetical protein